MRALRLLRRLCIGIAIVIFAILAIPLIQIALGYHFQPGWEVARNLVEHGNSVQECEKVRVMPWNMIGPTESQQRSLCIHEYAKITKDPSACELLMPSQYGWSCLGGAEKPNSRMCWFDFSPNPPVVGSGNNKVAFPSCSSNPGELRQSRCCEMARILYIDQEEHCDLLKDSDILFDQCQELLAQRNRDVSQCSKIHDNHVRSACEVKTRAL